MEPVSLLLGGGAILALWALGSGCQPQASLSLQELRFNRENLSKNQVPYDKLTQNEDRFFGDQTPNSRISHLIKPGLDGRREGRWFLENRGAESKSWAVGWEVTVHGLQSEEGRVEPDQLRLCNPYVDPVTGSRITVHTEAGPRIVNSIPPIFFLQGGIHLTCCHAGDIDLMGTPKRLSGDCTTVPVEDFLSFGFDFGDQNTLGCHLRGAIPDSMIGSKASCQLEFNQDAFPHTKIDAPLELMTLQRITKGLCIERGIKVFYEASRSNFTNLQNPTAALQKMYWCGKAPKISEGVHQGKLEVTEEDGFIVEELKACKQEEGSCRPVTPTVYSTNFNVCQPKGDANGLNCLSREDPYVLKTAPSFSYSDVTTQPEFCFEVHVHCDLGANQCEPLPAWLDPVNPTGTQGLMIGLMTCAR